MNPGIVPLGDSSVLIKLGDEIDLIINRRIHALANLITTSSVKGVVEVVPVHGVFGDFIFHCEFVLWRTSGELAGVDGQGAGAGQTALADTDRVLYKFIGCGLVMDRVGNRQSQLRQIAWRKRNGRY